MTSQPIIREVATYRDRQFILMTQPSNISSTGTKVWSSSYELLGWLHKNNKTLVPRLCAGKRVLELGSGCGLSGLGFLVEGADVTFTDVEEVMHLLKANVMNNTTEEEKKRCRVITYPWGTDVSVLGSDPFDVIIGTDIVYRMSDVDPLTRTLVELSTPRTWVILAMEERDPIVNEALLQKLANYFTITKVKKSHMAGTEDTEFVDIYQLRKKE